MPNTMIEPTPSAEMATVREPSVTGANTEMPFEFGGEVLDLNALGEGEGLPETSNGFDGLPELREDNEWDLSELNQNFGSESRYGESAEPGELFDDTEPSSIEPELQDALELAPINHRVEAVRKAATNPPLEGLINQFYTEQFPVKHEHALEFEDLEEVESKALNEYGFFLQDQQVIGKILEEDIIDRTIVPSDEPVAFSVPQQTEALVSQAEDMDFPVQDTMEQSPLEAKDTTAQLGTETQFAEVLPELRSELSHNIQSEVQLQPEADLPPEITLEQVAEVTGKYRLNVQPELRALISEEIVTQYQELLKAQEEGLEAGAVKVETHGEVPTTPERQETLKSFDLKTELGTTLAPHEQFKQHVKELSRLIALLIRHEEGIKDSESEAVIFAYEGEFSDIAELTAVIEDQFVMTVTAGLLDKYQEDLEGFRQAVEDVFDDYYDQLLVEVDDRQISNQITWSEAVARFDLTDAEDSSIMEITHEIREDGSKTLIITFPTLKGEYEPDKTTALSPESLPERLEKETRITPRYVAS